MLWLLLLIPLLVGLAVLGMALARTATLSDEAARRQWEERHGADGS